MRCDLRSTWILAAFAGVFAAAGCGPGGADSLELSGPEARRRLPAEVADLVAEDVILCLDDTRSDGAYRLWILRRPGGTWMRTPEAPKSRGRGKPEMHDMPASAIESLIRSRLPSMMTGKPERPRCRFTHWKSSDGAELQVREFITDQGWFASVERVAM